jgi:hypothetical protein
MGSDWVQMDSESDALALLVRCLFPSQDRLVRLLVIRNVDPYNHVSFHNYYSPNHGPYHDGVLQSKRTRIPATQYAND